MSRRERRAVNLIAHSAHTAPEPARQTPTPARSEGRGVGVWGAVRWRPGVGERQRRRTPPSFLHGGPTATESPARPNSRIRHPLTPPHFTPPLYSPLHPCSPFFIPLHFALQIWRRPHHPSVRYTSSQWNLSSCTWMLLRFQLYFIPLNLASLRFIPPRST